MGQLPGPEDKGVSTLRILGTTDLHMHLSSHDFFRDTAEPAVGLTRVASLIRAARAEVGATNCLLFDNGDGLQGTPMEEVPEESAHPLMQCFQALGYDAIGLGNHDFDFGPETLARVLDQAPCPVICSNLIWEDSPTGWPAKAMTLLERWIAGPDGTARKMRVGVFSVLPPQTLKWNGQSLGHRARMAGIVDCAMQSIAVLRKRGANIVIALAHSGLGPELAEPDTENAARALTRLQGLDAIIAGHSHLPFAHHGRADQAVPLVLPGFAGSHLGVIDLELRWDNAAGWQVTGSTAALRAISGPSDSGAQRSLAPEDAALTAILSPAISTTQARMEESVGHTDIALHSYFSGLGCNPAAQVVADVLSGWASDHMQTRGLPVLCAVAPSKSGGRAGPGYYTDIPKGPLKRRHIADLYLYPNTLRAVEVRGSELVDWLEMSAGWFQQIVPGRETPVLDPHRAGHNFDVIYGLNYQIDLSAPARFDDAGRRVAPDARRIRALKFAGQNVSPDSRFVVLTNNYRAMGGGSFPVWKHARPLEIAPVLIRDILKERLRDVSVTTSNPRAWRFAPIPDARVVLRTGAAAKNHLDDLHHFELGDIRPATGGFIDLPIRL